MSGQKAPGVPVGTLVRYFGSLAADHPTDRFIIRSYNDLTLRTDLPPEEIARAYPDGVAYELWEEGAVYKFGNRDKSVTFVRRSSFEVIS